MKRHLAVRVRPRLGIGRYRPAVELLEDRLPPGDLLGGWWQTPAGADSLPAAVSEQTQTPAGSRTDAEKMPALLWQSDGPLGQTARRAGAGAVLDANEAGKLSDNPFTDAQAGPVKPHPLLTAPAPLAPRPAEGGSATGQGPGVERGGHSVLSPSPLRGDSNTASEQLWQAVSALLPSNLPAPRQPLVAPGKDEGGRMKDEERQPALLHPSSFILHPSEDFALADFRHGSFLFQLHSGGEEALDQVLSAGRDGKTTVVPLDLPGTYQVSGAAEDLAPLASALGRHPLVRYVEPDRMVSIALHANDPRYQDGTLWGLGRPYGVRAQQAWDATTGRANVVTANIDTGVDYTHPDLYRNIWIKQTEIPAARRANLTDVDTDGVITFWDLNEPINQGLGKITDINGTGYIDAGDILATYSSTGTGGWADSTDADGNSLVDDLIGWNYVANNNRPLDDHGHGSHTTGTMAAIGNDNTGVTGVAWRTSVIVLKFINAGGMGSLAAAANAILYAANNNARVSNNSWGGDENSPTVASAISTARDRGHIVVAAAGNNGRNNDSQPFYPASYTHDNIISVAALDATGNRAGFSSFGLSSVDLAAPGDGIYSTWSNGTYLYYSGTSMAAPHVTGTIALLLSREPSLTYSQVISRVLGRTTPTPLLAGQVATGGRLNTAEVLNRAPVLAAVPDQSMAPFPAALNVTLTASDADGDPLTYTAQAGSILHLLDQQLELFTDGNYYQNQGGRNEKWVQAPAANWYFILPDGRFYDWDGVSPAEGTLLANLTPAVWTNPLLLVNAAPVTVPVMLTLAGNVLTIRPNSGYTGSFGVKARVSDGKNFHDRFINVVVGTINQPPVLAPIADRTIPSSQTVLTVPLSATDPEGQPLTFMATAQSQAYLLHQQYTFFTDGEFYLDYGGLNEKWVQGSGGLWYFIRPNGQLYRWDGGAGATGMLVGTPGASYWTDPNRLINPPVNQPRAMLSIASSTLTITRDPAWVSSMVVTVTVSDGSGSDSRTFTVTVTSP